MKMFFQLDSIKFEISQELPRHTRGDMFLVTLIVPDTKQIDIFPF